MTITIILANGKTVYAQLPQGVTVSSSQLKVLVDMAKTGRAAEFLME